MKTRWIVAVVLALLFLFAIRPRNRTTTDTPNIPVTSTPAAPVTMPVSKAAPAEPMPPAKQTSTADAQAPVPPAVPPSADAPVPQPGGTLAEVRDEIENIQFALRDYRTSLGENPIGNNAEITKALLGDNLKQVKIPLPPGATVNGEGQMCDRWGKPYFFHQLSAKQMEVRSAGPDREMWTGDDLVVK